MKILMVIKPYMSRSEALKTVGASTTSLSLARELIKRGHHVEIMTNAPIDDEFIVHTIPEGKRRELQVVAQEAVRVYRSGNFDLIHFNMFTMTWINNVSKLPDDVRMISSLHLNFDSGSGLYHHHKQFINLLDEPRSIFTSLSGYSKNLESGKLVDKQHIGKIIRIYPITNISEVKDSPNKDNIYDMIIIGRMTESKNIKQSLEFAEYSKLNTLIISSVPDRVGLNDVSQGYVDDCIDIINRNDNITWIKEASNEEILHYIDISKFFLCLYTIECTNLVVQEAMSRCKPIVGLYSPYIDNAVGDCKEYYIYPSDDLRGKRWSTKYRELLKLVSKVDEFYENPPDSDKVRQYLDNDIRVAQYEKLYEKLMKL